MNNILNNIFSTYDFFLFEVFAIPEEMRKEYLNKLLVRKNSGKQKNVRLIKFIYNILGGYDLKDWDEAYICKKLDITPRMLDCHKSRILKSLREFYFGHKDENIPGKDSWERLRYVNMMFYRGMVKEAKQEYLKLEKKIKSRLNNQEKNNISNYLMLSEIYLYLSHYYYYQRDQRKFNLYLGKAQKNLKSAEKNKEKHKINLNELEAIRISILKINYYKAIFKTLSGKSYDAIISVLEEIVQKAKNIDAVQEMIFAHKQLGIEYQRLKDFDMSDKNFKQGMKLAKAIKDEESIMVQELLLMLNTFFRDNKKASQLHAKSEKYYYILKNDFSDHNALLMVQSIYLRMLIFYNKESSDEVSDDFIRNLILFSQKADAISKWYLELSDRLASSLYSWEAVMLNTNEFSFDVSVNKKLLSSFEDMNYNTLIHFNKFYSPETLAVLYLNQIDLEFWKGKNCNYDNAIYFIKKLERLIKGKHVGTNPTWMISSKIGVNIFEDMKIKSSKDVFDKYFMTIKQFIESITSENHPYNILDDFAKLIFISKILKIERMTNETKNLGVWIRKNHPELVKALLSVAEIKKPGFQVA